jgi:UDP-N-acetylglucosamine diphosphorylase / glucose-1-phosphate thymidylyltransferase / UDP-N-acetylgalactosamine diphosphorylase / glucosamine-1-phosphate N-acetyltransferase / galactosamine-1-phosphate N-acetyltransferase
MSKIVGIVLAAGRGSRMQPFTDHTPKPLAILGSKTLLEWNMQKIAPMVDEFVVVINWLGELIREQIGDQFMDKKVHYAIQENPKAGTLNAFLTGVKLVPKSTGYIVNNADNYLGDKYYTKLNEMISLDQNSLIAAAMKYADHSKLSQFGVFRVDEKGGFIEIVEKPQQYVSDLVNIGLYYFPMQSLDFVDQIITPDGQEEYIIDLLNVNKNKLPVTVCGVDDTFIAISTVEDLEAANQVFGL